MIRLHAVAAQLMRYEIQAAVRYWHYLIQRVTICMLRVLATVGLSQASGKKARTAREAGTLTFSRRIRRDAIPTN